jgi:DNA-binding transcriptional MerR regulator
VSCEPESNAPAKEEIVTWSTQELANLADTTVNTVRHYHSLGLLDAPERKHNGYKQYRVLHLVRLIQIRRLAELGIPLTELGLPGDDGIVVPNGLRRLDAKVGAEMERLNEARAHIAAILRTSAPVDTPRGFESVAPQLSTADRSLVQVYARLYDEKSVADVKEMLLREPASVRQDFYGLGPDTDEPARQGLAARIADQSANWRSIDRAWLGDPSGRTRRHHDHTQTISEVVFELYNAAQRDVVIRATLLAQLAPRDGVLQPCA